MSLFKNWNKTGKVKAIILAICASPNLVFPMDVRGSDDLPQLLVPLIFGSLVIPLLIKFNLGFFKREIVKPTWNDNPITLRRPLSFFNFLAFFFLVVGGSIVIGTGIGFQILSYFGLMAISYGLGIFVGIWLALKWVKPK